MTTVKRRTSGSHATYGGWEPRTCVYGPRCLHGGRIILSDNNALWFHHPAAGDPWSAHTDCVKTHGWPTEES